MLKVRIQKMLTDMGTGLITASFFFFDVFYRFRHVVSEIPLSALSLDYFSDRDCELCYS